MFPPAALWTFFWITDGSVSPECNKMQYLGSVVEHSVIRPNMALVMPMISVLYAKNHIGLLILDQCPGQYLT